ncbi:protein of unknown function DUF480 [Candidatus Koribacter versatilis Ellin345]|uniref:UPF0502 protein Acid345_3645 n=1 Tax=Koribacter versatilis (strain Ellin345) TaxID=204669 RepID=Y3645_KORVE|nr:YceH family protein [Candidatus Koribacter versatilis]Q1IKF4.1 RecName: Full=UPF0502 protein Acid345_3645 [Candidatus Koribacter versatilis Ellin345]ABF42646.1 protein of unknown function DUF480 [Candidatus Koribacter versatilis Ellin345]
MTLILNPESARVLGCLIEKEITTPEYYPLSLNALINACNQKSNRDPAMSLDEDSVRVALRNLTDKGLARHAPSEGRVPKYEHDVNNAMQLSRREVAILCELLLRGPQTPGELRGRAERMYKFEGIEDVHSTLQRLMERDPALVVVLPRQPGTKEARYTHTLMPVDMQPQPAVEVSHSVSGGNDGRIAQLEAEVRELRAEIETLKEQVKSLTPVN